MKTLLLLISFTTVAAAAAEKKPQTVYEEGVKLMETGRLSQAQAKFEKAVKLDQNFDPARFQLAVSYHLSGKDERALKELLKVKTDPETMKRVPLLRGELLLKTKNWKEAETVWQSLPDTNPDLKALKAQGLARALEGEGRNREAADSWTEYLELQVKPTSDLFQKVAENRIKAGEKDDGLKYCDTTTHLAKHPSYRLLCKAHVYRAAKENQLAFDAVKKAFDDDKDNLDAGRLVKEWK